MSNRQFHEELKLLSDHCYDKGAKLPEGWQVIQSKTSKTGFQATIYKKGDDVAVVYRGTDELKDWGANAKMGSGISPKQAKEAEEFAEYAKSIFPNTKTTTAGHSLGGSLGQIVSAKTGMPAVTFNAYGTGDILLNEGIGNHKELNITNYGNSEDPVFGKKYDKQPGKTFVTNTDLSPDKKYSMEKQSGVKIPDKSEHNLSRLDLSDAVEIEPSSFPHKDDKTPVLKAGIEHNEVIADTPYTAEQIGKMSTKEFAENEAAIMEQLRNGQIKKESDNKDFSNYTNPETGSSKVYSREDIAGMSTKEYAEAEKEIMAQMNTIGVPVEAELKASVESGGTVYVQPYTRADGTPVKGYYRSKGH